MQAHHEHSRACSPTPSAEALSDALHQAALTTAPAPVSANMVEAAIEVCRPEDALLHEVERLDAVGKSPAL